MNSLLLAKHEKFFNRCLIGLPSSASSEDSDKLAIIYFCLHGLQLINKFNFSNEELQYYIDFIYRDYLIETEDMIGFRTTNYFKSCGEEYDSINLSASLFALYILLVLKSNYSIKIPQHKIMKLLSRCQIKSGPNKGAFVPTLTYHNGEYAQFGETDLRFCYIALLIRHLVKYDEGSNRDNDIDTQALQEFILTRLNHDGGFSSQILDESHLGFTFCAISALKLLNYPIEKLEQTREWLIKRQSDYPASLYDSIEYQYYRKEDIGGFNGRDNKFSDTCYSWWATGALYIMNPQNIQLINQAKAEEYLLTQTQNELFGGFARDIEARPDPMHSFMALASLSLWNREKYGLNEIQPILVISHDSYDFFKNSIQYS
ncbi:CDC43 [[Candida] subhashii]|uniref:CDC43 n=1 Tax=[Candida] subhashii TaxID=561895 RepID=A0A8J5QJM6_9ASCO|nr:CDC43 [[Candida] subhashii]KAG7662070.1 CDC43 [[Candida] subhashii]